MASAKEVQIEGPDQTPTMITQAELHCYLRGVDACREHERLRRDLTDRLDSGASVESGSFTLSLDKEWDRRWSLDAVGAVLRKQEAKELWQALPLQPFRRLRIKNSQGDYFGWKPSSLMVRKSDSNQRAGTDAALSSAKPADQIGSQNNA